MDAIEFAKGDIMKYENVRGDYVFSSQFKNSNIRFQTMTYKDCYERDILTNEIPKEPTFQFWETSNIRMQNIPYEVPHHHWNLAMMRQGAKIKEGMSVKEEYSFEDFDLKIEA